MDALLEKCMATEAKLSQSLLFMRFKSYLTAELKHGNPDKSKLPLFRRINIKRHTDSNMLPKLTSHHLGSIILDK